MPGLAKEPINEKSLEVKKGDRVVVEDILEEGSVDAVYQAKAYVLNRAIQDIGPTFTLPALILCKVVVPRCHRLRVVC